MNAARDARNIVFANEFEQNFGASKSSAAEVCYKVLHGWAQPDEMLWVEYAEHWKVIIVLCCALTD
jgi:hypothetical protein